MIRILLNTGLSVKFPIKNDQMDEGSYYVRLADGWICVGRHSPEHNGECTYMHPERLDMETMDADKVNHIQLPLKEIMASKGVYHINRPVDPTDMTYLMKRLHFDNQGFVVGEEIVSVADDVKKEE